MNVERQIAKKGDWNTEDMPKIRHATFTLERSFTKEQMEVLSRGNIPQEMEDKWFWYMENGKLFAHRSWTGFCIYIIEFRPDNKHRVTVNRNPEQYSCRNKKEDLEQLNKLLDWWSQPVYDHYNEWISETVDALHKAEKNGRERR